MTASESVKYEILQDYLEKTPCSKKQDSIAKTVMPGGDTRWSTYYKPYPLHMDKADGCYLVDVDGNRYIDLQNNYTVLVHGHRHPEILNAVSTQMQKDIIFGAPAEIQIELASIITKRLPGVSKVRFTNSGTEATMMAMRTARAFMKRDIILKMDGGYHGSHDYAEVNITPDSGDAELPTARVEKNGIPESILNGVMVARMNNISSVEKILKKYSNDIAAVIIEPVMNAAGIIPADETFLRDLRKLTDEYNVLLIFDEVVTMRLHENGLQGKYQIIPDITALGKVIGGGFAIGAFGGREDIMEWFDPAKVNGFHHSGTFNGHNLAMAAGAASLRLLDRQSIDRINRFGVLLRDGIRRVAAENGIWEQTTQVGSLLYFHWSEKPVLAASDIPRWKKRAGELPRLLHLELLNRGIFSANRGLLNISTPMTEKEIGMTIEALDGSLNRLKPYISENCPHLLH